MQSWIQIMLVGSAPTSGVASAPATSPGTLGLPKPMAPWGGSELAEALGENMQTGTDSKSQQFVWQSRIAESALHPSTPRAGALETPQEAAGERGSGEEFVRHKSAMFGMRAAVPLALGFWGLIAALMWAYRG